MVHGWNKENMVRFRLLKFFALNDHKEFWTGKNTRKAMAAGHGPETCCKAFALLRGDGTVFSWGDPLLDLSMEHGWLRLPVKDKDGWDLHKVSKPGHVVIRTLGFSPRICHMSNNLNQLKPRCLESHGLDNYPLVLEQWALWACFGTFCKLIKAAGVRWKRTTTQWCEVVRCKARAEMLACQWCASNALSTNHNNKTLSTRLTLSRCCDILRYSTAH